MEMEEKSIKMQDIRNLLDVRSMARKIEKRSMLRLGDIGRTRDNITVKWITLTCLRELTHEIGVYWKN